MSEGQGSQTIELTVNGEARAVLAGTTVVKLLEVLGVQPGQAAVERNGQVLPRARHGETALEAGDLIEVVTFVGGG
jgi:sulfur carrier protein